jgi:ABC-type nitrate/sulfonate/bicarbonate transport system substrate-binding protein
MRIRHAAALALAAGLIVAACGSDDDDSSTVDAPDVVAGEAFPAERCAANEAAGTVTFLTGFDYAAAASIIEVIVAEDRGYYDELCLDVEIQPSFSTANYALIAENDAQFSSGGSFSEVVEFAANNDAEFVALAVDGRAPIDVLMVKPGETSSLADLEGSTIGVKGKLPTSIEVMLARQGLTEGESFDTVAVEGFDPVAHMAIGAIVGVPGWRSNEPGALERAGVAFDLYDTVDFDIPGSFGIVYTNRQFIDEHPTAAEDFMRATARGLADAIAEPEAAATIAVELINAGGNPNFLSPEGEVFRWATDAALITELTPEGVGFGVPDSEGLQNELDTYAEVGLFGDGDAPSAADFLDDILEGIYDDDATVIWPAS